MDTTRWESQVSVQYKDGRPESIIAIVVSTQHAPNITSDEIEKTITGKIDDEKIEDLTREHFDMRPLGIITHLDLKRPLYEITSAYGHFGRNEPEFTWESQDQTCSLVRIFYLFIINFSSTKCVYH